MEIFYNLVFEKRLSNRGFFIGPYCPIYGIGALLIVIFLSKFEAHPVALFVLAVVICSILEYFTSYFMEKIFKARWWDYSNKKLNINGRICLETMIPFGIIACLLIYVMNPFFVEMIFKIPDSAMLITFIVLLVLFLADFVVSFNIISNFTKTIKNVTIDDKTDDVNKYVFNILLKKSFLYRRLLKAFPRIDLGIAIRVKKRIKTITRRIKK